MALAAAEPAIRPRRAPRRALALSLGPAFIASVAYVDPGNVATNVLAGARYGYTLLWVVAAGSVLAMLVQYLSAKLGSATGQNLAEACRRYPRPVRLLLWAQAELVVIMTDLAEFVGGAIALHMLFGLPLLYGGVAMALLVFVLIGVQVKGRSVFKGTVMVLLALVVVAFIGQALLTAPDLGGFARGLVPHTAGPDSLLIAAGIVGATVMPHVIYLHSGLCQEHLAARADRRSAGALARWNRRDVLLAMSVAGIANAAILVAATTLPAGAGETLDRAYAGFVSALGWFTALAFPLGLLASSIASSLVGVYSGQLIMQGFLDRRVPIILRRAVSALPPLVILALGVNATDALMLSQVALSFGIPFALIPLVRFTADRKLMGELTNRRLTTWAAGVVASLIIALNAGLVLVSL